MGYEQVVIVGDSAGGNLALNLALSLSQDPGERAVLVCCVVISPWLMVERAVQATADPATDFLSYAWLGRHARAYADAGGPGLSHMARALADCARTAPCLCVMGGDELLRPDAEPLVPIDLCAAPPSRESLNRPLLYAEPGESHDWLLLPPGSALLRDPEALERGWLAVASFIKLALATVPDRARRRRQ
jgi:acetyl esterase/lipase